MVTRNEVYRHNGSAYARVRVLWVNDAARRPTVILKSVDGRAVPVERPLAEFCDAIAKGEFSQEAYSPPYATVSESDVPERAKQIRRDAEARLGSLIGDAMAESLLFDRETRGRLLSKRARQCGCSYAQIRRDIDRYWRQGMSYLALYPSWSLASRTEQKSGAKRGRKTRRHGKIVPGGMPMDAVQRERIATAIEKSVKYGSTLQEVYLSVLALGYATLDDDADAEDAKVDVLESKPTYRQVKRIYDDLDQDLRLTIKRLGSTEFGSKCHAGVHSARMGIYGPGAVYLVDMTGAQVQIAAARDRTKKIGTANIYFAVDGWSNLVTGYYVSATSSAWESASLAIHQAASDKVSFCAKFGIKIAAEDWPVIGVPASYFVDNGTEWTSHASDSASENLQSIVANARAYDGAGKTLIERPNGTVKTQLLRALPGWAPKQGVGKGRSHPRTKAHLTLFELNKLIIRWILRFNKTQPLTRRAIPSVVLKNLDGDPTRLNAWNFGMKNKTVGLKPEAAETLYAKLLPVKKGWINYDGLKVNGFNYTAEYFRKRKRFEETRINGRKEIQVHVDPSRPEHVFYRTDKGEFVECIRVDDEGHFREYFEMDVVEENEFFEECRKVAADNAVDARVAEVKMRRDVVEKATKRAKAATKSCPPQAKVTPTTTVRKNREVEGRREQTAALIDAQGGHKTENGKKLKKSAPIHSSSIDDCFSSLVLAAARTRTEAQLNRIN